MSQLNSIGIDAQDRASALYRWMQEQKPKQTYTSVASALHMTTSGVSVMLRKSTIPPHRHNELLQLGFPPALLPEPRFISSGPKRRRAHLPA